MCLTQRGRVKRETVGGRQVGGHVRAMVSSWSFLLGGPSGAALSACYQYPIGC